MKFFTTTVVLFIFAYFTCASGKSLKEHYGNKVSNFKGQRKPLASPVVNGIHDNYTRSKRNTNAPVLEFQELLTKSKQQCITELKMSPSLMQKHLIHEESPTDKEKCLLYCILKKSGLMDENHKLSARNVADLAGKASKNNPLVVSIAVATVNHCNNFLKPTSNLCDTAHQINKCVARETRMYKMNMNY